MASEDESGWVSVAVIYLDGAETIHESECFYTSDFMETKLELPALGQSIFEA